MGAQTGRRAGHRADLAELYRTRAPGRCALAGDLRVAAHLRGAAVGVRWGRSAALAVAASSGLWHAPNAGAVATAGGAGGPGTPAAGCGGPGEGERARGG